MKNTNHEVNMQKVSAASGRNMWIIRLDEYSYESFKSHYGNTEIGHLLLKNYSTAISDISLLDTLGEEDKFMYKIDEEAKLEARQEGIEEGKIEVAKNLLDILDIETIAKKTGLTVEEIKNLKCYDKIRKSRCKTFYFIDY